MRRAGRTVTRPPALVCLPSSVFCLLNSVFCLLLRAFGARRIVSLQVAQRILDAGQDVLEERRDCVVPLVVAVRLVEQAALALAADVAQREVMVGARSLLLRLVLVAHLGVIDR